MDSQVGVMIAVCCFLRVYWTLINIGRSRCL